MGGDYSSIPSGFGESAGGVSIFHFCDTVLVAIDAEALCPHAIPKPATMVGVLMGVVGPGGHIQKTRGA